VNAGGGGRNWRPVDAGKFRHLLPATALERRVPLYLEARPVSFSPLDSLPHVIQIPGELSLFLSYDPREGSGLLKMHFHADLPSPLGTETSHSFLSEGIGAVNAKAQRFPGYLTHIS